MDMVHLSIINQFYPKQPHKNHKHHHQKHSVALKARSSPKVCEIFRILYDLPHEDDLVMQLQARLCMDL